MTDTAIRPTSARVLRAAIAAFLAGQCACAIADAPLYHLSLLSVPGSTSVSVQDINDAGQIVGRYQDQDFVGHPFVWDADGLHELARPPGAEVDGIAYAINNAGQIAGSSNDFVVAAQGLLWDAANPDSYTVINSDPDVGVSPADISDAGIVVGSFGVPSRAFVWTPETGLVDYGLQDPDLPDQQTRWAAINNAGKIVGRWNQHVSNFHATVGEVGTPAVESMSAMTEAFASGAYALNNLGISVGLGLAQASGNLVPVVFDTDGNFTEIPGATLAQTSGGALAINDSGVIVGVAGIGTANGPVPGMQAWVYRDGVTRDLFTVVDDSAGLTRFANALAINASGVIVGTGRDANDTIVSFMLTPIAADAVFSDGFDG